MRPNTLHWIYTAINSAYLMRSKKLEINFVAILLKQGYKWRILYVIWPVLYTHHHYHLHSFSSYHCPIVSRFQCEIIILRLFSTPR